MIRRDFNEELPALKPFALIDMALSPRECEYLRVLATDLTEEWEPGRRGSGYFKLDIDEYTSLGDPPWLLGTIRRLRQEVVRGYHPMQVYADKQDAWLIYYPEDACVFAHTDPAPEGLRHLRLNVSITAPATGGALVVHHGYYRVNLQPGNGVLFCPSEAEHAVTTVGPGGRLVLSVGALVPA